VYDLAHENEAPGRCGKCRGTGRYSWGASVNGKVAKSGPCHSCRGTGRQTMRDMMRNATYNRHKIAWLCSGGGR
jgi:hypothetical protein